MRAIRADGRCQGRNRSDRPEATALRGVTLRLSDIADRDLPAGTKGLPLDGSILRIGDLAGRGLNLLRGDLPMPVAVLKPSALDNNLREMQVYIERVGVKLAPHAKTTMCPQLFAR